MSAQIESAILGLGLVTPLGSDPDVVWQRLANGDVAEAKPFVNPETGKAHQAFQVPPKLVEHLGRNPRLRRSSAISYFAVSAGLAALQNAGIAVSPENAARIAVVYAVSDGGVVYTRKFYEQIVKQGANCASPLLFPETVYNAPASHLAAQLGIDGMSYTLVGDASTGVAALRFGGELLETNDIDYVLVVAAEELDWVLCEAYADWRLARTPISEGAAAVVLGREGSLKVRTHGGLPIQRQADATGLFERVLSQLPGVSDAQIVVSPDNGTYVDRAVASCSKALNPTARIFRHKAQLGEMLGASGLLQVVLGAIALEKEQAVSALAPVIGFSHQVDAALIRKA